MKKVLSLLLSLLLIFSVSSTAVFAFEGSENEYPVILVEGARNTPIFAADGRQLYDFNIDMDKALDDVKNVILKFPKAYFTNDYDEWMDVIYGAIAPYFEELVLDENGEISNGSYYNFEYDKTNPDRNCYNGYDYLFHYDWRLDPIALAAQLEEYVDAILASTKTEKVSLVGRCYGANIVNAYLYKYGISKVDTVVLYCSLADGCATSNSCFTGKFDIKPKQLEAYLEENQLIDDPAATELLRAAISFINSFHGLDFFFWDFERNTKRLYPTLAPEVLLATFGGIPSYWAMVSDENYEIAKKMVFANQEEKYKLFIEKIDANHEIQIQSEKMLTAMAKQGLNVAVVSKYNKPLLGIFETGTQLGDDTVETKNSSYGATCAPYGEVLSKDYLAKADMKYVSADKQIDASTCLFKDYTWFVKDIGHQDFPKCLDDLIMAICNFDGQMTVNSNESFPQFLQFIPGENSTVVPVKASDGAKEELGIIHFFKAFFRFNKAIFSMIFK